MSIHHCLLWMCVDSTLSGRIFQLNFSRSVWRPFENCSRHWNGVHNVPTVNIRSFSRCERNTDYSQLHTRDFIETLRMSSFLLAFNSFQTHNPWRHAIEPRICCSDSVCLWMFTVHPRTHHLVQARSTYERRLAKVANLSGWKQSSIHFPISCDHTPFVILNILSSNDCFIIIIITNGNEHGHPNLDSEKSFWTEDVVANTTSLRNYEATVFVAYWSAKVLRLWLIET